MHRQIKATIAIVLSIWLATTGSSSADEFYGQAGEFLRYSPSARALAMGRAYTALGQDANALHWNPASLAQLQRTGLSVVGTHSSLFGLSNYSSLSVGVPFEIINAPFFQKLDNLTLALSFLNLTSDITPATSLGNLQVGNSMSTSQGAFSIGLASSNKFPYLSDFSAGIGLDIIWNNIFGLRRTNAGLNAGLYYHNDDIDVLNWFTFALALKNINEPNIAPAEGANEPIPRTGKLGIAFIPPFCSSLPHFIRPLIVSLDYDVIAPDGQKRGLYFGLEYNIARLESYVPIRLRLGTNSKESAFTFGISLDLPASPFMKKGVEYLPALDYSFNFYGGDNYLGDVKQGAISFAWTPKTPEDWYVEAMSLFPSRLLDVDNNPQQLSQTQLTLMRVFDTPQLLSQAKYAAYGYSALLRIGDLQLAKAWIENDKAGLFDRAVTNYTKADDCISGALPQGDEMNSTSLLYRLQAEIKSGRDPEKVFSQTYVEMIVEQELVQFLRGFAYYNHGDMDKAEAAWHGLELPIAQYYLAKLQGDAQKLLQLGLSRNTHVDEKLLYPFNYDFNIGDNALFDYAELSGSVQWKMMILKLYPLSDLYQKIINSL